MHHYNKKLENQLKLLAAESFPDEEKELIRRYARTLEARGLNKGRISKAASRRSSLVFFLVPTCLL